MEGCLAYMRRRWASDLKGIGSYPRKRAMRVVAALIGRRGKGVGSLSSWGAVAKAKVWAWTETLAKSRGRNKGSHRPGRWLMVGSGAGPSRVPLVRGSKLAASTEERKSALSD